MANISRKMARARLNEALAMHLINDFTEHGAEVIAKLRRDKPAGFACPPRATECVSPVPVACGTRSSGRRLRGQRAVRRSASNNHFGHIRCWRFVALQAD